MFEIVARFSNGTTYHERPMNEYKKNDSLVHIKGARVIIMGCFELPRALPFPASLPLPLFVRF